MQPDAAQCYRALLARDARFDGLFYVAVRTTRIYCRPVCRVKPALRKNCSFFRTAAEAELLGYRPCLRCRPELAPGASANEAAGRLAQLALQKIRSEAWQMLGVADIADDLGVTERHLSRVLQREVGVSPVTLLQTQRLLNAKRLLTETDLALGDVAFASGFASIRRFNALFRSRYRMAPGKFRNRAAQDNGDTLVCRLPYRPPMAWAELLRFLRNRALPGVEHITEKFWSRSVAIDGIQGFVKVQNRAEDNQLIAEISTGFAPVILPLVARLRNLFDLDSDPSVIQPHLTALGFGTQFIRIPGAFDEFETATRAILGQQVSVAAATTVAGRFVRAFGTELARANGSITHVTPTAQSIAQTPVATLAMQGITTQRAMAIHALATGFEAKQITLRPVADVGRQIAALEALPGVGAWTAQYIAMRTRLTADACPERDLGIMKVLGTREPRRVAELLEPCRPYAVMQLWNRLEGTV